MSSRVRHTRPPQRGYLRRYIDMRKIRLARKRRAAFRQMANGWRET